jgi:hypothetical protein
MRQLKRMRTPTIQQRLGVIQDPMRIKLLDNTQYLIGDATDCIRIRSRKSYEGDDLSWICEKADVISAVFPPLTDVPFRKIRKEKTASHYSLTGLVSAFEDGEQQKLFTAQIPITQDIDIGDLLFRITDIGRDDYSIILMLQVTELLGTFGHSHIILQKVGLTIPTDNPPQEIIDTMCEIAKRRKLLGF